MTYSPARKQDTGKLRNIMAMKAEKLMPLASEMESYHMDDVEAIQKIQAKLRKEGWSHSLLGNAPAVLKDSAVEDIPVEDYAPPAGEAPAAVVEKPKAEKKSKADDEFYRLAANEQLAQLADLAKRPISSYDAADYWMEPKMDGWRILALIMEDGVKLFSRGGKTYETRVPLVVDELKRFPVGTVVDGEMVSLHTNGNGEVIDDWTLVQSVMSKQGDVHPRHDEITFMVFDLLRLDGKNARPLPLSDRRDLLETLFNALFRDEGKVKLVEQFEPSEEIHQSFVDRGYEGSIIKRKDARYASGARGAGWDKIKPTETLDGVIMGYRPGKNSFTGMIGSVEYGQYDADGKLVPVAACSGFDLKTRQYITDHQEELKNTVIEVRYEKSVGEAPRFNRFKRFRDDKSPEACTLV